MPANLRFVAHTAERLPHGWGVIGDDCVAAALACVILHGAIVLDKWFAWDWLR